MSNDYNVVRISVREWADYVNTWRSPKRIPKEIVREFDKAITFLAMCRSYKEMEAYGKFNPKPKNPPWKGYRAINLSQQWRLLFKIERVDDQTVVFIDEIRGDHKYNE